MALKTNKYTTLTATLAAGATTATLTAAVFDNGTQVPLIVEYDNTANIEVILADISGTALTNITRAQDGTADAAHTGTPKICQGPTPTSNEYWLNNNFTGKAWTAWTPVFYKVDKSTVLTKTIVRAVYIQIGKIVHISIICVSISNPGVTAYIYSTLPVAPKQLASNSTISGLVYFPGLADVVGFVGIGSSADPNLCFFQNMSNLQTDGNAGVNSTFTYEAA